MSEDLKKPSAKEKDSESEDEDYVPDEDASTMEVNFPAESGVHQQIIPTLSITKQRAVDDAFKELFGKPYISKQKGTKIPPKSKKAMKKKKILSEIFGGASIASKIIASSEDFIRSDAASRRRKSDLGTTEKVEVMEKISFAGQMMEIKRTVELKDGSNLQHTKNESKKTGIDAVLSQIKGPQKITTIDKTNVDWENFKDKTGMEEELRKKAEGKDAYLVKKDFLNRVDVRRFEQEKEDRNRKRAAAAASNPK